MRKATPIRTCVGCGERDSQYQMWRFFLNGAGVLVGGSGNGRGGYLHPRRACMLAFAKARPGFVRSLRAAVSREERARYLAQVERSAALS